MYFVESEPVLRNPADDFDSFSALASKLTDGEIESTSQHRFFFETPGWIEGNEHGIDLHLTMPGVTRSDIDVHVINNVLAVRGKVPLADLPKKVDFLSELIEDERTTLSREYCRAVRLPMAILGETLEVDVNEDGKVHITAKWDPSSERQSPPTRTAPERFTSPDE